MKVYFRILYVFKIVFYLDHFQALNYLPNLEELNASGNRIRSVSDLSKCKHLQEIDLSRNRITDLSGLKGLPKLLVSFLGLLVILISFSSSLSTDNEFICIMKTCHAIHREFFQKPKLKNFIGKILIFLIFLLKTMIEGTHQNRLAEAVLTSTHNLCFGSKIRKIGIPLQTHVFLMPINEL